VLLVGCAYIDQNLRVAPEVTTSTVNIGQGKKVILKVIDDRDEQLIGKRVNGYGMSGAKISNNQDLAEVLKDAVTQGLIKKGFELGKEGDAAVVMKVSLRTLAYDTAMGFWTGANIGKTVIKVTATNGAGQEYEKSYRSQKEIRTAFIGSQETNSKVVNEAFGEAVSKIFEDQELLNHLVK
jgi:uncharacterized lipoprotein YajG